MGIASRARRSAFRLIAANGRSVTLRRPSATLSTSGATTGSVTTTWTDYPARAVVENVSPREVDGSTVQAGDLWLTVSPEDVTTEPGEGWVVAMGASGSATPKLRVVRTERVEAQGVAVVYRIQARG